MTIFEQLAAEFVKLSKTDRLTAINVLVHLLPTKGVDFDEGESRTLENSIDMLNKALTLMVYKGPTEEFLLDRVKLLSLVSDPIAEAVEEPGKTYVDPDNEIGEAVEKTVPPKVVHAASGYPGMSEQDWY